MKYKSSVAAAAVLVVCIAAWFAVRGIDGGNSYNKEKNTDSVIAFDTNEIEKIEFENHEDSFALVQKDGALVLEGESETNKQSSAQILQNLLKISGRLIREDCPQSELRQYELDAPLAKVTFGTKSETVVLSLGAEPPARTERYVLRDDGSVFSIYTGGADALNSKKWQFMDLNLPDFKYEDICEAELDGENAFKAKKQSTGIWKISSESEGEYEVTDEKFRAKVGLYVDGMTANRAYDKTDKRIAEYGLETPEGTVVFKSKDGAVMRFDVRRDAESGEAAVVKNGGDKIYITINSYFNMLDVKKENFK